MYTNVHATVGDDDHLKQNTQTQAHTECFLRVSRESVVSVFILAVAGFDAKKENRTRYQVVLDRFREST